MDLNRSTDSPELFSKFVCHRDALARQRILETYYQPYRDRVATLLESFSRSRPVLHLSIHTFTPRFRSQTRRFDIGVLFDPARNRENVFSTRLVKQLGSRGFRAFPNQPYQGTADGLTTFLRTKFADSVYAGIELEINNRFAKLSVSNQEKWCQKMNAAIAAACFL